MKPSLRLIHWHTAEARARAGRLAALGYVVNARLPRGSEVFRELRRRPPSAVLISLDRLPSAGRDIAFGLLSQRSLAAIPVIFVGGAPAKVAAIRARLPGAAYARWPGVGPVLRRTLTRVRTAPTKVTPVRGGVMAGYAGTPLPAKLGIKAGTRVALLGAPPRFAATLGTLPAGAGLTDRGDRANLALWFVRSRTAFSRGLTRAAALAARMPVWVVSPKKTGPLASDLSQPHIRAACLAAGLVDYKVCAVDPTWSGLLFRRRGRPADPPRAPAAQN